MTLHNIIAWPEFTSRGKKKRGVKREPVLNEAEGCRPLLKNEFPFPLGMELYSCQSSWWYPTAQTVKSVLRDYLQNLDDFWKICAWIHAHATEINACLNKGTFLSLSLLTTMIELFGLVFVSDFLIGGIEFKFRVKQLLSSPCSLDVCLRRGTKLYHF